MANRPFVNVEIYDDGGLKARVDEDPYSRSWSQFAQWKIQGANLLPDGAAVYLQFVNKLAGKAPIDGPLFDGDKKKGKYKSTPSGNTLFIESIVTGVDGKYAYQIGYELDGTSHLLLDPEIVVEGQSPQVLKFLRAIIAAFKQSEKRRFAKTAKTSKKAKRPAKRKAKKR
jgi:hypothetical protein